jgi:hypothetical protein
MKLILLALAALFLCAYIAWHSRLRQIFALLGARPAWQVPIWKQVKNRVSQLARRERLPDPELWILTDFSPNALVMRSLGGKAHIVLTDGLLRTLSASELDALIVLCLHHAFGPRKRVQTLMALQLQPLARLLQLYPAPFQLLLAPVFAVLLRIASSHAVVLACDSKLKIRDEVLLVAAALQKIAVLSRKIPLKQWNFALDPLFLVSPLTLDASPLWIFPAQPTIEVRRRLLLGSENGAAPCETAASLP